MNLKTLISQEELEKRIKEIATQITKDYENKELVIVCILTGAVYFATDLTKYIKNESLKLDFMKVSSYGNSTESTGEIKIKKDLENSIAGKNVIIVEDIIDTGLTLSHVRKMLEERGVIDSAQGFIQYMYDEGYSRIVQEGDFEFTKNDTYANVARILTRQ